MANDNTLDECRIPKSEIFRAAEDLTLEYADIVGREHASLGLKFDQVFDELIYPKYEVDLIDNMDLGRDEVGKKILGQYDPLSNNLFFDPVLRRDPRRVFTQWHEIGHLVLHAKWLRRRAKLMGDVSSLIQTTEASISPATSDEMEVQANLFASQAAAPDWLLISTFERRFGRRPMIFQGAGKYTFCLNCGVQERHVQDFTEFCWLIAGYIKGCFASLSQESLGYRIQRSGVVKNQDRTTNPFRLNRVARDSKSFVPPHAMLR